LSFSQSIRRQEEERVGKEEGLRKKEIKVHTLLTNPPPKKEKKGSTEVAEKKRKKKKRGKRNSPRPFTYREKKGQRRPQKGKAKRKRKKEKKDLNRDIISPSGNHPSSGRRKGGMLGGTGREKKRGGKCNKNQTFSSPFI